MADNKSEDLLKQQPPHNIDIEKALLASLMSVEESYDKISDIVGKDDFYAIRHQHIFSAISHLATVNEPYDTVMVHDWLETQKILDIAGGEKYLADIVNQSPATLFNLTSYAQRVRELSTLRQIITASNDMLSLAYEPKSQSVSDILDTAESKIFAINEKHNKQSSQKGPQNVNTVLNNVFEQLQELKNSTDVDGVTGLKTNFMDLNNKTRGLQDGDLIIVAARPSMGKTTFAMNLAEGALMNSDLPVVVFSMEMPAESIVMRLLSSFMGIHQGNLRSGKMSEDEWAKVMSGTTILNNKKLYIDDSTALPPSEMRSRCRRIAKENNGQIGMIVVDYLQLMKVPGMGDNRVGEISEISRSLKALARELNCPVIALSQLNRSLENRPNKRPIMSDLRESGAIEQDADLIMFIYRDEVYNENSDLKGQAEIIIGKQRNGPIGKVHLGFEGVYTRFKDLMPEHLNANVNYDDE